MHDASALRAAFSDRDWAVGEDYLLQDRITRVRRYGEAVAGSVAGVRGDYWVRVSLTPPPVSVCDCGRPRCRHAAALVQAYLSARVPVVDAESAVRRFLEAPHPDPLAAAVLGDDLLRALALPPSDPADIWALPEHERLLALETALRAAQNPDELLLGAMRRTEHEGPLAEWLYAALCAARLTARRWLDLFSEAHGPFIDALLESRPEAWHADDTDRALGLLYLRAADNDLMGTERIGRLLTDLGAGTRALRAVADLCDQRPDLARALLPLAQRRGEIRWACRIAERAAQRLEGAVRRELESALLVATEDDPPLHARLMLHRAARLGGRRELLQARRAALRAGVWPRLRSSLGHLLAHRPDGPLREVELWLADGDIAAATLAAARSESSHVPERLLGDALSEAEPAQALQHYLRAMRIAQAHGFADALLDTRIAALRERIRPGEQVAPPDRRT